MKISIITACFNSEDTLRDAIESVLSQDYDNIEYIIVDGASTDGSMIIVESYGGRINKVISEPDHGIYDALNKGVAESTGDYIGFVHSDDVLASIDVISSLVKVLNENPKADAVYGDLNYVKATDLNSIFRRWVSKPFKFSLLKMGWMPPHPTLYLSKSYYQELGAFDLSFKIAADYESILRYFSQPGFAPVYIPKVMVNMRIGGASNGSLKAILRKMKEDYRAIKMNLLPLPLKVLLLKNLSKLKQFF